MRLDLPTYPKIIYECSLISKFTLSEIYFKVHSVQKSAIQPIVCCQLSITVVSTPPSSMNYPQKIKIEEIFPHCPALTAQMAKNSTLEIFLKIPLCVLLCGAVEIPFICVLKT